MEKNEHKEKQKREIEKKIGKKVVDIVNASEQVEWK